MHKGKRKTEEKKTIESGGGGEERNTNCSRPHQNHFFSFSTYHAVT